MTLICNLFIYIFEQFISFIYFNSNFDKKRNTKTVFLCLILSFFIQYSIHSINSNFIFIFNILSFFVCNFCVLWFCYETKKIQAIFNVGLLEGVMISSELIVIYSVSAILKVDLTAFSGNDTILFVETAATKIFYFFVVMLIAKSRRQDKKKNNFNNFAMILLIVPFLTVLIIIIFGKILLEIEVSSQIYFLFSLTTVFLLVANIIVFLVHEKVVLTLEENTRYQLEKQKAEISDDYYRALEQQYDKSNILIHDIKRQLNAINHIAKEEKCDKICDYLDTINDSYEIQNIKRYTTNKLLNVIITRYANMCSDDGVILFTDIRNIDLSFISDSDLTAIVDNLLENSFEAAIKSSEKTIVFEIHEKNENFIILKISNTCGEAPEIINGTIESSKIDKDHHGYGLRSVKRVVSKYNGEMNFEYIYDENTFVLTILFIK